MMHEPIQAKGPTMSEQLMEQYRLRGQRKCRNACIAAIVTVVLVLAVAGGVWWTAGDGSALVRNMFKPKATPATQPVVNSTATFAYRTAPEFLAMEAGDRGTGNVNYSPASMWMALAIAAQGANGTTRSQLNELLGSGSLTDSDYQSLLSSINGQYSGAKSEMSAANSLWIDDDYSLASDYQSTVKKMFEAEVTTLPFDDQAAAKMSDWIAKHTNGSLKPKITLRDREVLSIINTVYADGRWKDPFEEQSTGNGTFHGEAGDAQVPMMHRTFSQMAYGHDEYNTWQRVLGPQGDITVIREHGTLEKLDGCADPAWAPAGWIMMHRFNDDFGALANLHAAELTGDDSYRLAARRFLARMRDTQRPDGGFGPAEWSQSIPNAAGCILQEMVEGRRLGVLDESFDPAIEKAAEYLLGQQFRREGAKMAGAFHGMSGDYTVDAGSCNARAAAYAIMSLLNYASERTATYRAGR